MPVIYLIPTPLGDAVGQIPAENGQVISSIDYFVVENLRTARRYISSLKLGINIDLLQFVELSEHTAPTDIPALLEPIIKQGRNCGLMSEAGLPCVADPGAMLVEAAHKANIEVQPLVGPSSIMLALMSSGMNGQSFAFNGYLPLKEPMRTAAIKRCLDNVRNGQTQIFIETPYRNNAMLDTLLRVAAGTMRLCVACNLMSSTQNIKCTTVDKWRASTRQPMAKEPAIFILGQ